ncbi:MAG: esterase/lipase family protein [Lysobacterales bacterium]
MTNRCLAALLPALLLSASAQAQVGDECVVLLHGLARTSGSMKSLEKALVRYGYKVANVGYPSTKKVIEQLALEAVERGLEICKRHTPSHIHFVTHSLGGILVRYYFEQKTEPLLGRVVMLGPPNQGSHVVDNWRRVPGYRALNGPAGMQLGTDANSVPNQLGPVSFPLGIVAGTKTVNPILSQSLPNPDDGKVHVENTKVTGMTDHIQVPHSHTFMMKSEYVIQQTLHFLMNERFHHP